MSESVRPYLWISTGFQRGRPGFDITAGPPLEVSKVTGKFVLPLSLHVRMVRLSFFCFFKDYKPEVRSHNSFESQLCGTLKNPHAIRKRVGHGVPSVVVCPSFK